jgi:hypothetical protein
VVDSLNKTIQNHEATIQNHEATIQNQEKTIGELKERRTEAPLHQVTYIGTIS